MAALHVTEKPRVASGEGAASSAPTAPHATPRLHGDPTTGAERFWSIPRSRIAVAISLVGSVLVHAVPVIPLDWPAGMEVRDVEGEAAIPIDVFEQAPAPAPPPPAPVAVAQPDEPEAPAPRPPRRDAGAARDASARDARPADADGDGPNDASGSDAQSEAAAIAARGDAGPRDPKDIVGAAGEIQADRVLVMVVVNAEVIRSNPVGRTMGFLLRGIPQWDSFMSGTSLDPVGQIDWLVISGPSLVNTSRDVVLIHYSAPDSVVDRAIDTVSRRYAHGGRVDAGVPGVRATLALADRAERVLLRPQSGVLAVVPPLVSEKVARQLVRSKVPAHVRPNEALYFRMVTPYRALPDLPKTIEEVRLRIVPRSDQGVDVWADADTASSDAAEAANAVRQTIRLRNNVLISFATAGLLDRIQVTDDASGVHLHLIASRQDLERMLDLVGSLLGVQPDASN